MFLSCGDALFDLFINDRSPSVEGSSTRVSMAGDVGGSPLNVATGLSRLGHHSGYFTKLSHDVFGQRMREYMALNHIDTTLCIDTPHNTTLALVDKQPDGSACYQFYINNTADISLVESELPERLPDEVRVVHFASYCTAVEPCSSSLIKLAEREQSRRFISYDPNLRLAIEPDTERWRSVCRSLAGAADFIKASDEDVDGLYGAGRHEQFVADCFSAGVSLVSITRGADGASAYSSDGAVCTLPGAAVNVVDTVGAGDTFQAAMLHWLAAEGHIADNGQLIGRVDLEASTRFALQAAAVTCSRAGADLPTLSEVQALLS